MPVSRERLDDLRIDALFDFQALILNFEEEVPFPENIAQPVGGFAGLIRPLFHQFFGDRAAQTRRQRDQPAAVFRQQVVINSGLVVKAFEESGGNKLDQIAIAFGIFAEQDEVVGAALAGLRRCGIAVAIGCIALGRFAAIVPASLGDVHFAADDWLHAARFGRVVERFGREQFP